MIGTIVVSMIIAIGFNFILTLILCIAFDSYSDSKKVSHSDFFMLMYFSWPIVLFRVFSLKNIKAKFKTFFSLFDGDK